MSDKYTMEVLRIAAAQICQNVGYTSTMASALDVMQDVLYRISKELTRDLKLAAEHCNRRRPNLTDVAWTLRNCNIDLKAFSDYLDNVEPVPPAIEVPRYPVRRPEDPEYWKPKDLDQYIQQQQQQQLKQQQQSTINGKREDDDEDVEVIVAKKEEEREGGEGRAEEQNNGQKIKTEGDLEVEAIENDAKREEGDESNLENMEALKTKEESEVNTKKTKGVISSDFVPTIIYKYLHYDVPPPPTPSPPTPTPTPELSPPRVDIQTGGENLTAPLGTTTTITASKTPMSLQQNENEKRDEIFDENPLQQQQQQQQPPHQLQQKIKKHKKHKLPIDFVGGGELMMPMMNEKTPNSIAIEKRKKSLKRAIKQQQEQFNNEFLFDQQQQQQHQLNPLQLEKLQKKQERLKLKQLKQQQKRKKLQEQEMLQQQQQQQQQFQPIQKQTLVAENHDLFMVNNNKQQQQPQLMKTESPNFLTTTPTMATTTTIATNNVIEKVKTEFDYYNSNNNSNNNNNNHNDVHKNILQQQQQQQQFDVNLPNLPTGTTITPAPPIMTPTPAVAPPPPPTAQKPLIPIGATATTTTPNQPIANSNNVVALVKPGKKRGRKPGSKNQPKISLQQQQLLLLQKHMAPAMGDLMGGIRMNENVSKLFKQPTFPTPGIFNQPKIYGQQTPDNPLIGSAGAHGGGVGGAIDLTTTTTPTPPNNYLIPHQQPQTPFNPAVHFNHPNLYPFAATARPGLIPGGGIPFFPTQSQASLPMEFLKQFKHHDNFMLPQHQQLQQQQQQMLKNNNNGGSGGATGGGGDLYKNVCNIPPLLPEHLKIPSQQQQSQQQMAKQQKSQALKKVKNFTPSETIDLLSDDSNDNYPEISTKLPPKQQKQQQPFLYPLQQQQHSEAPQQQNNRKSTKKQQQHLQQDILLSTLQQQQQSSSSSTTLSVPPISKLAGGADLIPLTNTGLAYSSQNIPHTSLTGGGGCQLGVGGGGGSTVDTLLGDITITKTTTTNNSNNNSILLNESNQQLQQQQLQQHDEQSLLLKKNKHSKKDKKFKKIKEGKINKKNKKEKKDKDKKHKLEKILLKQQQQQQQQQHHHDNNILDDRELLKKQKREKKKEKQRRMAESMSSNLNELEQRSPSNAGSSPSIPKLTLKLAGKNSPITTMSPITTTPTTTKEPVEIVGNIGEEQQQQQQQHQQQYQQSSREYSPELAKFSPLVTRPPKQKAASALSPTPHLSQSQSQPTPIQAPPAPQQQPQQTNVVVVPPPPPSSWTSGDTFPASSVLLPSQLFGGLNDPPILPATSSSTTKSKDNVSVIKTPSNVDFINDIKPHSYVDEEGHMIWICPACGKVDDGSPMIGCDGCDAWYHWACVGITVAPKQNEDWFCRVCIMRNMAPSMVNMSDSSNKKRKRTKKK